MIIQLSKRVYPDQECENEKCNNKQICVVFSRHKDELMAVCEKCSEKIVEERAPEYVVDCPNCGCWFGVN